MQGLPLVSNYCSSECSPASASTISGPGTLCGSGTYTSPLQGQGYTYSWTASPASAFTASSGSGPTFQTANAGSGSGTITLTVSTGDPQTGCQFSFTKEVSLGAPPIPQFVQRDASDMCYSQTAYFDITNYDPGLTYTLVRTAGSASAFLSGSEFRIKKGGSGTVEFTLTVTGSSCGSATSSGEVTFDCDNGYAVYPNPSNDAVTVEQQQSHNQSTQSSTTRSASPAARTSSAQPTALAEATSFLPFTVRLYDMYGKLWLEQAALAPALQLRTVSLPAGSYIVQVLVAGVVVQRVPLGIQH